VGSGDGGRKEKWKWIEKILFSSFGVCKQNPYPLLRRSRGVEGRDILRTVLDIWHMTGVGIINLSLSLSKITKMLHHTNKLICHSVLLRGHSGHFNSLSFPFPIPPFSCFLVCPRSTGLWLRFGCLAHVRRRDISGKNGDPLRDATATSVLNKIYDARWTGRSTVMWLIWWEYWIPIEKEWQRGNPPDESTTNSQPHPRMNRRWEGSLEKMKTEGTG